MSPRTGTFLLVLAVVGCSGPALAQSPSDEPPGANQLHDITVSVSFGSHLRTDYSGFSGPGAMLPGYPSTRWALDLNVPVTAVSVQVPLTRSLLFETDFLAARTGSQNRSRTAVDRELGTRGACVIPCEAFAEQHLRESRLMLGAGGNVLVRVGPPRVAILLGAGLGVQRTTGRLDTVLKCEAVVAGGCADHPDVSGSQRSSQVTLRPRVLYGVEAVVAPRLAAFTTLRWGGLGAAATYDDSDFPGMSLMGGVRVALRTRPAAGGLTEVTVTQSDGVKRRGRLVSLTRDGVVLREDGRELRLSTADVSTIDKVGRHAFVGALVGTAYAISGWLVIAATRDSCADCEDGPWAATIMTPVSIGAGAGIGALVQQLTRDRRRLYPARSGASLRFAPVVAKSRAGATIGVVW
jgi:hypothetical protein